MYTMNAVTKRVPRLSWNDIIALVIANPGINFCFPAGVLPHPAKVGFMPPHFSEWKGEKEAWKLLLKNGGRIHVRISKNNSLEVHFDQWDPDQGLINLLNHILKETQFGFLIMVGGLIIADKIINKRRYYNG